MSVVNTRTHIVAGKPIEVGDRRLLPSILVTTVEAGTPKTGFIRGARIRPISVVEESTAGNRWHAIPNTTHNKLSMLAAAGFWVALIGSLVILLVHFGRKATTA